MVSLTEKPCRFTLAGLFSSSDRGSLMNIVTLLGIDIGKHSFHLHGQDAKGHQVLRKKTSRSQLLCTLTQLPACTVVMESCGGAHWPARQIGALGHDVKLIAPLYVKRPD
jgi:transposase